MRSLFIPHLAALYLTLLTSSSVSDAKLGGSSSSKKLHLRQERQLQVDCDGVACVMAICADDETTYWPEGGCCDDCATTPTCEDCPNGYFDGCRTCTCTESGPDCTDESCLVIRRPVCFGDGDREEPEEVNCETCNGVSYYNGCNRCVCTSDGGEICQLRFCEEWEKTDAFCDEPQQAVEEVGCDACGGGFFDGCNVCGCTEGNNAFCTLRFCSDEEKEDPYCYSEVPSSVPSELPSEVPSELPSGFPSEQPSMFQTNGDAKLIDFDCLQCESGTYFDGCRECRCSEGENGEAVSSCGDPVEIAQDPCYDNPPQDPFCVTGTMPPPEPTLEETVMDLVDRVNQLFVIVERLEAIVEAQQGEDSRLQTCPTEKPDTEGECNLDLDLSCAYDLTCCPGAPPEDCVNITFISCDPITNMYMVATVDLLPCPPPCPALTPKSSDECSLEELGLECSYEEQCCEFTGDCVNTTKATCLENIGPTESGEVTFGWSVELFDLECQASCPQSAPESGGTCSEAFVGLDCQYDPECCADLTDICANSTAAACLEAIDDAGGASSYTWLVSDIAGPDCGGEGTEEVPCPATAPAPWEACSVDYLNIDCDYDYFCCESTGQCSYITSASCVEVEPDPLAEGPSEPYQWAIAQAGILCPTCSEEPDFATSCDMPGMECYYNEVCCESTGECLNTTTLTCLDDFTFLRAEALPLPCCPLSKPDTDEICSPTSFGPGECGYDEICCSESDCFPTTFISCDAETFEYVVDTREAQCPGEEQGRGALPGAACPDVPPGSGTECDTDQTCSYDVLCCPGTTECYNTTFARCDGGSYKIAYQTLDCAVCPDTAPKDGDFCTDKENGMVCQYEDCCDFDCYNTTKATCSGNTFDVVVEKVLDCPGGPMARRAV